MVTENSYIYNLQNKIYGPLNGFQLFIVKYCDFCIFSQVWIFYTFRFLFLLFNCDISLNGLSIKVKKGGKGRGILRILKGNIWKIGIFFI